MKPLAWMATILLLSLCPAQAQRIYAGAVSGSYTIDICPKVAEAVQREYFRHQCVASQGTGDNLRRVLGEPTSIGLGQLDVLAGFIEANPGQLTVIDPKIGFECLFAVARPASGISRLEGLSPRTSVALPPEQSGSSDSFRFLQRLNRSLSALRAIRYHDSVLDAVRAVAEGEGDIAFFVQAPNIDNPVFQAINDAGLSFVPVISRPILNREAAGISVYEPREVGVTPTLFGFGPPRRVVTTCTPVVVFTGNPGLFPVGSDTRADQETLVKTLTVIEQPDTAGWRSIFRNMVEVSQDRLQSLF
jgi:hypothetical protein